MHRSLRLSSAGRAATGLIVLWFGLVMGGCAPSSAENEASGGAAPRAGVAADPDDSASLRQTSLHDRASGRSGGAHVTPQGRAIPSQTLVRGGPEAGRSDAISPVAIQPSDEGFAPHGEPGERGRVVGMSGALTVRIETAEGELEVRLAEIDTPVPDLTQAALETGLSGREIRLVYSGARRDRYERALAQLLLLPTGAAGEDAGDVWLQAWLVSQGLARVMTHADNQAHAADLLSLEARARAAGRGLWSDPAHAVRDPHPDARAQDIGSAQIIEGRVVDAVQLETGRIYLNFGADYRSDFTVRIDAADSAAFLEAGLGPDALLDHRVRVRGWLVDENGPMMRLDHPARLEVLAEDPRDALPR